ncbi:MAG: peptidase E [Bacteroidota bacterium]|nr:peptidase E [Bacteroidota bacterium]MDP4231994.1 peptidase E [Bacteroidota bacterium]MDP4241299.1 peptidase E [Bacteroidota bacterium]MDP4287220.1 peptidase E [Bacteroidota bacterium]
MKSRLKNVVAFGGDSLQADPTNKLSAKFILGLTGKSRPRACFLPTASGDPQSYIQGFYARYSPDLCEATHLELFARTIKDLRSFLLAQDAIYVGGGNTANMLAIWRVHGVDKILREAYERGIVMCGTSAGSLCWFECGVTDSFSLDLDPLYDGLGFVNGSNCPHYNTEPNRVPQYHKFIQEGLPAGYAADDGAALHFIDGKFAEAVSSVAGARAFKVELADSAILETPIPVRYLGE